ncbi:MAG: AsnC family protein [Rhodocyclaceae bacterium]|nr:AsnC family protein [Rhodocyclaceae bacterium]
MKRKPVCHDLHALRAAGASYAEIAALTGLSIGTVHSRLNPKPKSQPKAPRPHRPKGSQERPCLCCQKPFLSAGSMNRLCNACRIKSVSPYALAP